MKCNLDYETRSDCDLKEAGAYVYARHPSTIILCACYSIDDGPVKQWPALAGYPLPADLEAAMRNPACEMHAWNAQFERLIGRHVLGIDIPLERWRCTAALARARGLPGRLEDALDFLKLAPGLAIKRRGRQIMLKWAKPLPEKQGGGYANDINEYYELIAYCSGDVTSEALIGARLVPFTPMELADFQATERVNDAGLPIDCDLAYAAQTYGRAEKSEINGHLQRLTHGVVSTASQHPQIKEFLRERLGAEMFERYFTKTVRKKDKAGGYTMGEKESTDKSARADFLNSQEGREADYKARELIEYVDDAGKSSVAKFAKMYARAADTGRAEGAYLYAGAIQTKRFSSTGVQMHNLPRDTPDDHELDSLIDLVLLHSLEADVMDTLSSLLRPTIMAPDGRTLAWGDWSSVEARAMPWLAQAEAKLDLYRRKVDVYRVNAEQIFGVPYDDVNDHQRQIGKVAELSLQFGGAKGALRSMGRNYGVSLTEAEADRIVQRWREANRWAAEFSNGLFDAFMATALGIDSSHGPISYRQITPMLPGTVSIACDLPCGSTLYYHGIKGNVCVKVRGLLMELAVNPDIERDGVDGVIDRWETAVTYEKTLPTGFYTERIWHGLLAENVTQATCASLLRDCIRRLAKALPTDAMLIGHTHDELIVECDEAEPTRTTKVLEREMLRVPKWLSGFPLGCTVAHGPRYVK